MDGARPDGRRSCLRPGVGSTPVRTRPPDLAGRVARATALGYALTSGGTAANVDTLADLASDGPGDLLAARAAVAELEIGSPSERLTAAALLGRAARRWRSSAPMLAHAAT